VIEWMWTIIFTLLCIAGIIVTYTWVGVSLTQKTASSSASSTAAAATSGAGAVAGCCASSGGTPATPAVSSASTSASTSSAPSTAVVTAVQGVTAIDSVLIILLGITAFLTVAGNGADFTDYSLFILHAAMLISILSLSIACIHKLNAA
jgi:hypothetical protein